MNTVLLSDPATIIYESIILLFLIFNTFRLRSINKRTEEMVSLQMNRIREESLDASLRNTMYIQRSEMTANGNHPYDVTYHQEEKNIYGDTRDKITVQVEEKGILSTKKYVVHVFDTIAVGSDDSNAIILNDTSISRCQIQLLQVDKNLFIKNLDVQNTVSLLRNKKSYPVTEDAVCMKTGDTILLGNTSLKITIL